MRPEGVIVPMVTPMHPDGTVDGPRAAELAMWMADAEVAGLMLAGTSGEGHALSIEQLARLVTAVATAWRAASSGPLLVAVSGPSTGMAIARGVAVRELGVDAIVATPPFFFRYTDAELVAHYEALDAIGLPVFAYDTPRYTGNPFTVSLVEALASMPHVVGLKMSAGDLDLVAAACAADRQIGALAVAQGDEDRLVSGLALGAAAIIPGVANILPRLCVALYQAVRRGDLEEAERHQSDLRRLGLMHSIRRGVVTTKAALHVLGRCPPYVSAPFLPLDDMESAALRRLLSDLDDVIRSG